MKRALWVAAPLLFFVGAAEVLVRVLEPDLRLPAPETSLRFDQTAELDKPLHQRDPVLGWRLTADARAEIRVEGGRAARFSTNDQGFRGAPFDAYKDPGTVRVVVAGDSNPMGFGVDDREIYPVGVEQLLGQTLATRGIDVEVINLAVEGYSSHQVRLLLDDYLPELKPDALVVQVGFNDLSGAPIADADRTFSRPAVLGALETSHAYRWFRRRVLLLSGAHRREFRPVPRVGVSAYADNLRAIVERATALGATPLLVATHVRPSTPLVLNEVALAVDADTTWVTQQSILDGAVAGSGLSLPDDEADGRYRDVLAELADEHPTWPLPRYQLSRWHTLHGDSADAAMWDAAWRAVDADRARFEAYMSAVREIATESRVAWVDGPDELERFAASQGWENATPLFLDFVHLNASGHRVMAQAITRRLARAVGR